MLLHFVWVVDRVFVINAARVLDNLCSCPIYVYEKTDPCLIVLCLLHILGPCACIRPVSII